jgi:hypothetical protein
MENQGNERWNTTKYMAVIHSRWQSGRGESGVWFVPSHRSQHADGIGEDERVVVVKCTLRLVSSLAMAAHILPSPGQETTW